MNRKQAIISIALALTLSALATAQGGFGGAGGGQGGAQGGGFGGAQGGGFAGGQGLGGGNQQGRNSRRDMEIRGIEQLIPSYLNGKELKSVLTPGEFCEWTMKLKAGQIVIAQASSDAFDPALEIVDDKGKVLGSNDDRYPGDQRPLLLWRCEQDGAYALHVRCFHDKSGGQFIVQFRTYESVDLLTDEKVDKVLNGRGEFLVRIPMKAGEIKEIVSESGTDNNYASFRAVQIIAPNGLPNIDLAKEVQQITSNTTFMAPVAGDYYALADLNGFQEPIRIHAWTRDIVPQKLAKDGSKQFGRGVVNSPSLWELSVKAGDLLEISTPDLSPASSILVTEIPDISKFDVSTPETNPFYPQVSSDTPPPGPAFVKLSARARDSRIVVFHAWRDAKLWVGSNGWGAGDRDFAFRIQPAATIFGENESKAGKLRIGNTDYWAFDAKAGDVMTLANRTAGFTPVVIVRDPEMREIRHEEAALDQTNQDWRMIVQRPGQYLVAVSCLGDGGGGSYTLSRKVFHAKEFTTAKPAQAAIANGQVQIWQFTAEPNDPLYIHWRSDTWAYDVNVYDEKGQPADFQRERVDGHDAFGILKVYRPQTFVIVLTGQGASATYSIELNSLPGYKPDAKREPHATQSRNLKAVNSAIIVAE